jgi:protein O-mannosyl-transferase
MMGEENDHNRRPNVMDSICSRHLNGMVIFFIFTVVALAIYSNTFKTPFLFDDVDVIVNNPALHLDQLSIKDLVNAGFSGPCHRRPIANISLALNFYFGQHHVAGYHLVNLLIHIFCGVFLYLFINTTLAISSRENAKYGCIALCASLIWLVHPLQTQAVTYIVQRMTSLSAMFFVLSLLLYAKGRMLPIGETQPGNRKNIKYFFYSGSIMSGMLAFGSKENAAMLPLFIFLYEWYFFQGLSKAWLKRNLAMIALLLVLLLFIGFSFLGVEPIEKILAGYARRDFTLLQRFLTEFRVVVFYVGLIFFPHPNRLNIDHDFPVSHSLIDPFTTVVSMVFISGLALTAILTAKKYRFLSFCLVWFLGNLIIESSVIPLEILFEHRNYLPSMLFITALVLIGHHFCKSQRVFFASIFIVAALFSMWTYERNHAWKNEITIWADSAMKSPMKPRPRIALGNTFFKKGKIDEAIVQYQSAIQMSKPGNISPVIFNNLGVAYMRVGKKGEGISCFKKALDIDPRFADAYENYQKAIK